MTTRVMLILLGACGGTAALFGLWALSIFLKGEWSPQINQFFAGVGFALFLNTSIYTGMWAVASLRDRWRNRPSSEQRRYYSR